MKKSIIAMLATAVLLGGCSSMDNSTSAPSVAVSAETMQHRNWFLTSVDGVAVEVPEGFGQPNLEIGEGFNANGYNGCNSYFGQAELNGDEFRVTNMANTMMACPPEAMKIEMAMNSVLSNWSKITMTAQSLELKNADTTLLFKLQDWVN